MALQLGAQDTLHVMHELGIVWLHEDLWAERHLCRHLGQFDEGSKQIGLVEVGEERLYSLG
jgi:hypothetical protein